LLDRAARGRAGPLPAAGRDPLAEGWVRHRRPAAPQRHDAAAGQKPAQPVGEALGGRVVRLVGGGRSIHRPGHEALRSSGDAPVGRSTAASLAASDVHDVGPTMASALGRGAYRRWDRCDTGPAGYVNLRTSGVAAKLTPAVRGTSRL